MAKKNEVRKSKEIISMIPKVVLSKVEDYLYHLTLFKFGKHFWDFKKNELIKQDKYAFEFNATEVTKLLGIPKQNLKREMTKAFDNIYNLGYKIDAGNILRWVTVFRNIDYDTTDHKVKVRFNESFVEHVIDVKKDFVKISLDQIMTFKSKYTRPIYDLIKSKASVENQVNCTLEVEEIRKHLHIESKYKRFGDFKTRVIVPVLKDLKNSDLRIKMELVKWGVKVHALNFKGTVVIDDEKSPEEIHPDQLSDSVFDGI